METIKLSSLAIKIFSFQGERAGGMIQCEAVTAPGYARKANVRTRYFARDTFLVQNNMAARAGNDRKLALQDLTVDN